MRRPLTDADRAKLARLRHWVARSSDEELIAFAGDLMGAGWRRGLADTIGETCDHGAPAELVSVGRRCEACAARVSGRR